MISNKIFLRLKSSLRDSRVCLGLFGLLTIISFANTASYATECPLDTSNEQVAAVLAQRTAFNAAIRSADIEAIASVLADDVLLITGTGSDIYQGRDVQLALWRSDGTSAERDLYVRTPSCIQPSPTFPIAMEYGTWRGGRSNEAASFASGSYSAKWRNTDGVWLLEVETYMTERCQGSFCPNAETD